MKEIKLHLPLLLGIEAALEMIFHQDKKSDHVVPALLKAHPRWGSRDRNFVAENTYEIVRNKRLILHCLGEGAELRKMVGTWLILKDLYNGSEYFSGLDPEGIRDRAGVSDPAIRFSVPDELNACMISELGADRWYTELEAMSQPAEVYLRTNLRHISRQKLQAVLQKKGIETIAIDGSEAALRLMKRANLTGSEEFRNGFFEVQDAGSQQISSFLNPEAGTTVVDACAGAGGKSLHLADLMQNSGQILAMDVEEAKLRELNQRAARNKVSILTTGLVSDALLAEYESKADYLLLDVPCSGTGVIRRNPDAKERLSVDFIKEVQQVQQDILTRYRSMVKPGGKMVYATCSLLPSENGKQVEEFLSKNEHFRLLEEKQIWPSETSFDGFYMARMERASQG